MRLEEARALPNKTNDIQGIACTRRELLACWLGVERLRGTQSQCGTVLVMDWSCCCVGKVGEG